MSDVQPEATKHEEVNNSATPKRTPSKRKSALERHKAEAEEVLKNMGATLELDGKRRTRSSLKPAASPTVATPPPAKKAKTSPTTTPGRGRGRKKIEVEAEPEEKMETNDEVAKEEPKTPVKKAAPEKEETATEETKEVTEDNVDSSTKVEEKKEEKLETVHENNVEESKSTPEVVKESVESEKKNEEKMEVDEEPADTKSSTTTTSDAIKKTEEVAKTPEKSVAAENVTTNPPATQPSPVKEAVESKCVVEPVVEKTEVAAPEQEKTQETPKPAPVVEEPAKNGETTTDSKEPELNNEETAPTSEMANATPEVVKEIQAVTVPEPSPVKTVSIEHEKLDTPTNEPALAAEPPTETEKPKSDVVATEPTTVAQ